jgi:hypothetical protein
MGLGPVGFDLDMTLIDSRPAIMAAFAAMSRDLSASIDLAAVDSRLGVKLEDELAYWFPPEGIAEAAGCYRRHYVRLAAEKTSALPGAAVRSGGNQQASSSSSLTPSRPFTASRSTRTDMSPAIASNAAMMAGLESISVMSRSKPTGPSPIPPPRCTPGRG